MRRTTLLISLLLLFLAAGCDSGGDDGNGDARVAGRYEATTLEASGAGLPDPLPQPVSLLGLGAELSITLDADGTARGRLFVPALLVRLIGGRQGDAEVTFSGTYAVDGSTVTFDVEPDEDFEDFDASFLEDAELTFADGTLDTEVDAAEEIRLRAVLERQN